MDFLLSALQTAAPVIGSAFGPVGTILGGLGAGLIGAWRQQSAANEAENKFNQQAALARALAMDAYNKIASGGALGDMINRSADLLGGRLAAAGLTGSSIADQAYAQVASDAISRLYPAQANAILGAARLGMQPSEWLFNTYSGAASSAAQTPGMDLGFLVDMAPQIKNWFGSIFGGNGGVGGGSSSTTNARFDGTVRLF